jgi:hypothetical protein
MSSENTYVPGDWNVICDRTGFKVKASQTRETWDGLRVRKESWEPRQPQDYVRGVPDDQTVPWARTPPPLAFIPVDGIITALRVRSTGVTICTRGGDVVHVRGETVDPGLTFLAGLVTPDDL